MKTILAFLLLTLLPQTDHETRIRRLEALHDINVCGNDVLEPDFAEVCDGPQLGGATCQSLGFDSGTLSCAPGCAGYDTSLCTNNDPPPPSEGWQARGTTTLRDSITCAPGLLRCEDPNDLAVVNAWSGATFDTTRNRLIVVGGGHGDNWYNGVNAFDLDTDAWSEIVQYTVNIPDPAVCNRMDSSGKPVSRHTYGGLAYVPQVAPRTSDYVFMYGGSAACMNGTMQTDTWLLNLVTNTWEDVGNHLSNGPTEVGGVGKQTFCAYDAVSDRVYCASAASGWLSLHAFNPTTRTWSVVRATGSVPVPYGPGGAIAGGNMPLSQPVVVNLPGSPLDHQFTFLSKNLGFVHTFDVNTGAYQARAVTGATEITDPAIENGLYEGVGLAYDEARHLLVAWSEEQTNLDQDDVYEIDPQSLVVTKRAMTAGSGPTVNNAARGVYGRWQYSPTSNVFVALSATNALVKVWGAAASPPPLPSAPSLAAYGAAEIICPDGSGGYLPATTVIPNDPVEDGCLAKPVDVSVFFTGTPFDCAHLKPGPFYLGVPSFGPILTNDCVDVVDGPSWKQVQNKAGFGLTHQRVAIVHNSFTMLSTEQPFLGGRGELLLMGIPDANGRPPQITFNGAKFSWRSSSGNLAVLNFVNIGEFAFGSGPLSHKATLTVSGVTQTVGPGRLLITSFEGGNAPNDPTLPIDDEVYFKNVLVKAGPNSHNVYLDRNGLHYIEGLVSYGNPSDGFHALKMEARLSFLYGSWLGSAGVLGDLPNDNSGQSPFSTLACATQVIRGNHFQHSVNTTGSGYAVTIQVRVAVAGCDYPQGFLSNTYPAAPYTGPVTYRGTRYAATPFWDSAWWASLLAAGTSVPAAYSNPDLLRQFYLDNSFKVIINGGVDPKLRYGMAIQPTFPTTYPSPSQTNTPKLTPAAPPGAWEERLRVFLANNCFVGGNAAKVLNHWPPEMACSAAGAPAWLAAWPECLDGAGFPDDTNKAVFVGPNDCTTEAVPAEMAAAIAALEAIPDPPWRHWTP